VELGQVAGKKTTKCLIGDQWAYRDGDIDRWLPAVQSAQAAGQVGVYRLDFGGRWFAEFLLLLRNSDAVSL